MLDVIRQTGRVSVVTPPAGDLVSLSDLKLHLRVEHSDDDALISRALRSAVEELDSPRGWLGRSLLSRTLRLTLDESPPDVLFLPGPPVTSVTTVTYRNTDDEFVEIDADDYLTDLTAEPALLWIGADGWPSDIKCSGPDLLRVDYVAGYASRAAVPAPVAQWLLIRVGELYRDREASVLGTIPTPLRHVERMLDNHRIR
jgi:uncharacterized phiE125 gp8 family phage protein